MRTFLLVTAAAVALAACQKPAANSETTTAAQTNDQSGGAGPVGSPQRRPGLWETSMAMNGKAVAMASMKMCTDAAMEAKAPAFHPSGPTSLGHSDCTTSPTHNLDGSWSFTSTCPIPGVGQTVSKGTASGDWSTAYHVHVETDTTGASVSAMNGHKVMDMDGKWLGPCPADMAPGDMEMANGMKFSKGKLAGAAAMLKGMTGGGSSSGGQ